jgi:hypothetical protein
MRKQILKSVGITILVAGVTVGGLALLKQANHTSPVTTATSPKLVLDHSKDYGACTLVTATAIRSALGDTAANLQPPVDAGITRDSYFGDGAQNIVSDSQTCVYAFAPGGTSETTISGTNALTIKKTKYSNNGGPKAVIEQIKANPEASAITALGDSAFYIANTTSNGPGATASFTLLIFKNNESTTYTIIQPAKTTTLTTETAKTALLMLTK